MYTAAGGHTRSPPCDATVEAQAGPGSTFIGVSRVDLAQLFNHYGTDKDRIGYSPVYHALFDRRRHEEVNLLEIGIGTMRPGVRSSMHGYALAGYRPGGSLRAWRDYFPRGAIYGVDIQSDTEISEERITTAFCDSTDPQRVATFVERLGGRRFDIIIDDGSHVDTDQLATLENFYPHLEPRGVYVIEDVHPDSRLVLDPASLEPLCHGDPFFFAGRGTILCVIYKQHLERHPSGYGY